MHPFIITPIFGIAGDIDPFDHYTLFGLSQSQNKQDIEAGRYF
jgi:hypothetical protein